MADTTFLFKFQGGDGGGSPGTTARPGQATQTRRKNDQEPVYVRSQRHPDEQSPGDRKSPKRKESGQFSDAREFLRTLGDVPVIGQLARRAEEIVAGLSATAKALSLLTGVIGGAKAAQVASEAAKPRKTTVDVDEVRTAKRKPTEKRQPEEKPESPKRRPAEQRQPKPEAPEQTKRRSKAEPAEPTQPKHQQREHVRRKPVSPYFQQPRLRSFTMRMRPKKRRKPTTPRKPEIIDVPFRKVDEPKPRDVIGRQIALRPQQPPPPKLPGTDLATRERPQLPAVRSALPAERQAARLPATPVHQLHRVPVAAAAESAEAGGALAGGAALASLAGPLVIVSAAAAAAGLALYALNSRAKRLVTTLGDYEANLARSRAQREVLGLQRDIRAAQFLGPDLAKFNDAMGRIERSVADILDVFTKAGLQALSPILEKIGTLVERMADDGVKVGLEEAFYDWLETKVGKRLADILRWTDGISTEQKKENSRKKVADGGFFSIFQNMPLLTLDDDGKVTEGQADGQKLVKFDDVDGREMPAEIPFGAFVGGGF
jgi:hypothetical protein